MQQLRALQLPANDNRAFGIDPVNLKYTLRNIWADRGNLHGGRFQRGPRYGTLMPGEQGPSTPIIFIGRGAPEEIQTPEPRFVDARGSVKHPALRLAGKL